jgi:hypothetical protein
VDISTRHSHSQCICCYWSFQVLPSWGCKYSGKWCCVFGCLLHDVLKEESNEAPWSCEMSGTMLPVTQHHIPEDLKHQQRCCGNLRSYSLPVYSYRLLKIWTLWSGVDNGNQGLTATCVERMSIFDVLCGYYLQGHYNRRRYATRCIALATDVTVVMWSVVLFRICNSVVLPSGWHDIPHR